MGLPAHLSAAHGGSPARHASRGRIAFKARTATGCGLVSTSSRSRPWTTTQHHLLASNRYHHRGRGRGRTDRSRSRYPSRCSSSVSYGISRGRQPAVTVRTLRHASGPGKGALVPRSRRSKVAQVLIEPTGPGVEWNQGAVGTHHAAASGRCIRRASLRPEAREWRILRGEGIEST